MANKLTVEQFVEQVNDNNLDYALQSHIIIGSGIVCEEDEKVLCTGESIYTFIYNDDSFEGPFTVEYVNECITAMLEMA